MNDKLKHIIVCASIAQLFAPIAYFYSINWGLLVSFIVCALAAFGKELHDIKTTGFDWQDLFADGIGYVFGLWISSLILLIL
jgi:hypothetical protein